MTQWLSLQAPNAGDMGSVPGWGTKIPHAAWLGWKKRMMLIQMPMEKDTLSG